MELLIKIKKNKKIIAVVLFCYFIIGFVSLAQAQENLKDAFNKAEIVADAGGYDKNIGAETMVANLINIVLSIIGVFFLILMIYGGGLWMTAMGDEQKVTKAKSLITAAVIGIIVIISAYAITYFVVEKVSSGVLKQ